MSPLPSAEVNIQELAKRARQYIEILAGEIGPRPAGSAAERQAMDYAAGLLSQWGYSVSRQTAAFAPPPRFSLPYLIGALALGAGGWLIRPAPWLTVWLPVLFMVLPQWSRGWIQRRKPTLISENLFARRGQLEEQPPSLILCAHIDSAAATPLRRKGLLKLYSRGMDILQRLAWMIAAMSGLQMLGWGADNIILFPLAALGTLAGLALAATQLLRLPSSVGVQDEKPSGAFSPGANDNASGVGVLLALAEALAQQEADTQIAFLFTGAEETGLHGAKAFAEEHQNWKDHTALVCLDMVGKGENLYYVAREGVFFPLHTSPSLNQELLQANPRLQPVWYTLRSGDFAAFCRAGFHAASLQSGGAGLVDWSYHSIYDTHAHIETPALEHVLATLVNYLGDGISEPL